MLIQLQRVGTKELVRIGRSIESWPEHVRAHFNLLHGRAKHCLSGLRQPEKVIMESADSRYLLASKKCEGQTFEEETWMHAGDINLTGLAFC